VPIPVYALGGIDAGRLQKLLTVPAGAGRQPAGAAAVSAFADAEDPAAVAREWAALLTPNPVT
jgi:thiamine monophosphate synthase